MAQRPDAAEKSFGHSDPAEQKGFTMIPNTVMYNTDLSIGARLLYGYMKYLAWRYDASMVEVPLQQVADELGVSLSALHGYIKELRGVGLVDSIRRGLGLSNAYIINPAESQILHDGSVESNDQDGGIHRSPRARAVPLPLEPKADLKAKKGATHPEASVDPADRPKSVNRVKVKDEEYLLARDVLQHFNRLAETRYSSKEWIGKIIMRIREHPEVTLPQHRQVIERAFISPWWKGPASPSVVYGSAAQFERSVHAVGAPSAPRALTPEEVGSYGVTWGTGTPYASPDEARRSGHPLNSMVIEGHAEELD